MDLKGCLYKSRKVFVIVCGGDGMDRRAVPFCGQDMLPAMYEAAFGCILVFVEGRLMCCHESGEGLWALKGICWYDEKVTIYAKRDGFTFEQLPNERFAEEIFVGYD
jgi:hypothetical protein